MTESPAARLTVLSPVGTPPKVARKEAAKRPESLAGKVVSEVSTRARQAGVPCHAIVGTRELDSFGVRVLDLQAVFEASTPRQISAAARRLAEVL